MPLAPSQPCARPGCPSLASIGRYCEEHAKVEKARKKQYDKQRGSSAKRGYCRKWQNYRKIYLAEHPLCVRCEEHGQITPATEIDHIINHNGNYTLFWAEDNHQGLCKSCHSKKTCKENGGFGNKSNI